MFNNCCNHSDNCCCNKCKNNRQGSFGGQRGPQGKQGVPGPQGMKGDTGPAGVSPVVSVAGTITGEPGSSASVIETYAEQGVNLLFTIPAGAQGPQGARGQQGFKGDKGDAGTPGKQGEIGPTAAMIPFCIGKHGARLGVDELGNPQTIAFSGFAGSYYDGIYLEEGEWLTGKIKLDRDEGGSTGFVMTYTGKLKKIYMIFAPSYEDRFEMADIIRPFVCIALLKPGELEYTILEETMTYADTYQRDVLYRQSDLRRGASVNLDIEIAEGTLVAIIAGVKGEGNPIEYGGNFTIHGGLYLQ